MPLTLQAHSVIAAEYQGLSVGEMTELRVKARESQVQLRVVKNTLAKRAFEGTDYDCLSDALRGQMVYAFSMEEPGGAARVFKDYAAANNKLVVKLIAFGGELLDPSELRRLASIPTYDQAISLLMAVMKAPVEKLARTMSAVPGKLTRTIAAIRDQK